MKILKKPVFGFLLLLTVFLSMIFSFSYIKTNAEEVDYFDMSNVTSLASNELIYEDTSLPDGWYQFQIINGSGTFDPVDSVFVETGQYSDSSNVTSSKTFNDSVIDINVYIKNGYLKIYKSGLFPDTNALDNSSFSLILIEENYFNWEDVDVYDSSSLVYEDINLVDGWYEYKIKEANLNSPETFEVNYDTVNVNLADGTKAFDAANHDGKNYLRNINLVGGAANDYYFSFEVLIRDGYLQLYTSNNFSGVNIESEVISSLTLVEAMSPPEFNYSELTLEVPYYDIPTISEIQSMLTATDNIDGDLTSSIQLVDENITDFVVGDPLNNIVEIFTSSSTTYSTPFIDLQNYSLIYIVSSELYKINLAELTPSNSYYYEIGSEAYLSNIYDDGLEFVQDNSGDYFWLNDDQSISQENIFNWVDELYLIDMTIDSYQATFNVEDSNGNTSYATVTLDLVNDKVGDFEFNDSLNDISVPIYITDTAKTIEIDMYLTDYNETFLTALDTSNINSDYTNTYTSEYDYQLINDVTTTQTISGETNTGESFSVDLTIQLNLIDDIGPVFDGSPNHFYVSNETLLSLQDLRDLLVVSDETDLTEDLTISTFANTYTSNYEVPGVYQVVFSARDTYGNVTYHDIDILVVDMTPPLYTFDSEFIVVTDNDPITEENLGDILANYGIVLSEQSYTYSIIEETYFGNENQVGTYTMSLQVDYDDGSTEIVDLEIEVVPEQLSGGGFFDTSDTLKILGVEWYWYALGIAAGIYFFGFTKTGRKVIGKK